MVSDDNDFNLIITLKYKIIQIDYYINIPYFKWCFKILQYQQYHGKIVCGMQLFLIIKFQVLKIIKWLFKKNVGPVWLNKAN